MRGGPYSLAAQPLPYTAAWSFLWALPGNEQLHQVQVATGGRSMQGCPAFTVAGIDLGPGFQELLHHLPEVVNAALQTMRPKQQP